MAQSGYTPILIYASGTATNVPLAANMTSSASGAELALNYADGKLYYKNSSGVVTLLASSTTVTNSFSAGTTGFTPSTATTGAVTLGGTLITSNGGTGLASYTAGDLSYYASGTALTKLAIGTAGQFLTSTGTAPQWSTLSGVAVTTFSAGTTGFTPSSATSGAVTLAGTLATTNGGTGLTSFTSGGVVYASSTSALATSPNLFYDSTNARLGILTTNPQSNIHIASVGAGGSATARLQGNQGSDGQVGVLNFSNRTDITGGYIIGSIAVNRSGDDNSGTMLFNTAQGASTPSEKMRITPAGDVGIGTNSPSGKLHVVGAVDTSVTLGDSTVGDYAFIKALSYPAAADGYTIFDLQAYSSLVSSNVMVGGYGFSKEGNATDNKAYFALSTHNGTGLGERLRVTSAGNVGIGTSSPNKLFSLSTSDTSNSVTGAAGLQIVNTSASAAGRMTSVTFGGRATTNYPFAAIAGILTDDLAQEQAGDLAFYTKPTPTAVNPTERMRVTSAGNVGIGTSSPVAKLDVENSSAQPFGTAAQLNAVFKGSVNLGEGGAIGFDYFGSHTNSPTSIGYAIESQSGSTKGSLVFGTRSVTTDTAPTERARINAIGQLLVGTTATVFSGATGSGVYINGTSNNQTDVASLFVSGAKIGYAGIPSLVQQQLTVYDSTAGNGAGTGGAINFAGDAGGGQQTFYGAIETRKDNGTSGDYGASLNFYSRPSGGYWASAPMILQSTGNLLVGATSTNGSTSNTARVVGGIFSSLKGDILSAATNTSYTMFDTGANYACYIVSVIGVAADAANYSTTAVVNMQNTSVSISYIDTGGLIFITNSGTAIQVNQNSGGTMGTIGWTALRIH